MAGRQPLKPPSRRKAASVGVVLRPRMALRCGKRPKRAMISRWPRAWLAHGSPRRSLISFSGVAKRYPGGQEALRGVSFAIEAGEFAFIAGHSLSSTEYHAVSRLRFL